MYLFLTLNIIMKQEGDREDTPEPEEVLGDPELLIVLSALTIFIALLANAIQDSFCTC